MEQLTIKSERTGSLVSLCVILFAQETINKQGKMIAKNAKESILKIVDATGFSVRLTLA